MRLTNEKKETLIRLVMSNAYDDRKKELQEKWNQFSELVWQYFYKEHEEKMNALPDRAFPVQSYINIRRVDDKGSEIKGWITVYFTKMREHPSEVCAGSKFFKEAVFVRRKRFYELNNPATLPADHWIVEWHQALCQEQKAIAEDVFVIKSELNKLLASVTTKKRLLEAWPAGAEWIEKALPEAPVYLPAVIETKKLNTLLCDAIGEKSPTC